MNNLKQIGVAFHDYHGVNKMFPYGYYATGAFVDGGTDTTPGWGWAAYLLPYLEQLPLYDQLNFSQPVQNSSAIADRGASVYLPFRHCGYGHLRRHRRQLEPHLHGGSDELCGLLRRQLR